MVTRRVPARQSLRRRVSAVTLRRRFCQALSRLGITLRGSGIAFRGSAITRKSQFSPEKTRCVHVRARIGAEHRFLARRRLRALSGVRSGLMICETSISSFRCRRPAALVSDGIVYIGSSEVVARVLLIMPAAKESQVVRRRRTTYRKRNHMVELEKSPLLAASSVLRKERASTPIAKVDFAHHRGANVPTMLRPIRGPGDLPEPSIHVARGAGWGTRFARTRSRATLAWRQ
jgi:hypothetical protein